MMRIINKFIILILILPVVEIKALDIKLDSLPIHYPLLDSLQINYNLENKVINFSEKELKRQGLPWWEKSILYSNYFSASVNLFFTIDDIKEIWEMGYDNDPYSSCQNIDIEYKRINTIKYKDNIPLALHCILLRENQFFQGHCRSLYKTYDTNVINQLSRINENNYGDLESQLTLNSIIDITGKYPGRSIVGITLESAAWSIIQKGDLKYLDKNLTLLKTAVESGDLHPRYLASAIDRIEVLKNNTQIYGTQYQIINGKEEVYPIKDQDNLDKLRAGMGLPPLEESRSSLGDIIIDRLKNN